MHARILMTAILIVPLMTCKRNDDTTERKASAKATPLTEQLLSQTPDDRLEALVMDHLNARTEADSYERSHEIVSAMSKGFQMMYATWLLEAEVNNGGFHQFFWNHSGLFAKEALEGLKLVGADEHAKLVGKSIAVYESEKPKMDNARRHDTLEAFGESARESKFDELDSAFYALKEDLSALRIRYIRAHPRDFVSP